MSEDIEQITKTPLQESVKKEKDPKKVAAGKKLAEYNKRAKEALKEKMKREAEKAQENKVIEERETGESADAGGWIPELSFTTVISLVGIGLTAINMFMSYRKGTPSEPSCEQISSTTLRPLGSRLPEPPIQEQGSVIERPQQSKIPVPKMGMH